MAQLTLQLWSNSNQSNWLLGQYGLLQLASALKQSKKDINSVSRRSRLYFSPNIEMTFLPTDKRTLEKTLWIVHLLEKELTGQLISQPVTFKAALSA